MNLITKHTERYATLRYAALRDTVSARTLFNALLNRHGAIARHVDGKTVVLWCYGEDG